MKLTPAILALTLPLAFAATPAVAKAPAVADMARVDRILRSVPLIDGHNDWAEARVDKAGDARWTMDLRRLDPRDYDTDIERLRAGRVGGQFWSVYVSADLPGPEQVKRTLEPMYAPLIGREGSPR
jgi:membrane dipeptidase